MVKKIQLEIPNGTDVTDEEVLLILATQLYGRAKLSLGQAADLARVSKRKFMELLGSYSVSVFNYPATDLCVDVKNA